LSFAHGKRVLAQYLEPGEVCQQRRDAQDDQQACSRPVSALHLLFVLLLLSVCVVHEGDASKTCIANPVAGIESKSSWKGPEHHEDW
jgi:hypothetical protein